MHTEPDLEIDNGGTYAKGLTDSSGPVIIRVSVGIFSVLDVLITGIDVYRVFMDADILK